MEGETPDTLPRGPAKRGSCEAEKDGEAFLGEVRGASATPSWGDEEVTSHTQEADVMHTCVRPWWPGCRWVRVHIYQVNF